MSQGSASEGGCAPAPGTSLLPSRALLIIHHPSSCWAGSSCGEAGSLQSCLLAKAGLGSLMPFLEHHWVHLLWLFTGRSLRKSFPLLTVAQELGLVCSVPYLAAQSLWFSLPLSQVTVLILSQFSFPCFGDIQPLSTRLCCWGLALRNFWLWLYFQLGEKAAKSGNFCLCPEWG